MNIRSLINVLKNYKWQSFLMKSYVVIFCVICIPLGVFTAIISNNYRKNMLLNIKMLSNNFDSSLTGFIDSYFEKIDKFYLNLKNSEMYMYDFSYMLVCDDLGTDDESESLEIIKRYMENFVSDNDVISSIYLYSKKSDYVYSTTYPTSNFTSAFQDNDAIFGDVNKNGVNSRRVVINHFEYDYITITKRLFEQGREVGRLVFNIDAERLCKEMQENDINLENWFILDSDNNIIYSSDPNTESGKNREEYEEIRESATNAEQIRRDNTVTTEVASNEKNVKFVFINKYDTYSESRRIYVLSILLIGMLMLALGIVISAILTIFFYKYLATIVDMLQPYATLVDVKDDMGHTTKEMQLITNSILAVTTQNKDLREELSNRVVALKKAQSSMLQMQINPHFLHNTLNTINALVIGEFHGDMVVSDMITNLAEILRYSLNTKEYLVTLDTELMYLNTYIEIQRVKYNNRFSVEYNIDERSKECKVLKLSLQPLVENAITHGIIPKNKYGTIKISTYMNNDLLKIIIEDDGVGIKQSEFDEINKKINNDVFMLKKSLGIDNTAKRIRLIFGDEYGLKIDTSECGTSVVITIPKIM